MRRRGKLDVSARRPLSAREREVIGLLADGLSGAEIAENLVLSAETVRTHIRNAMAKLGASTRSQAVVMALELDELTPAQDGAKATASHQDSDSGPALIALLTGLTGLADVDAASIYLTQEGGMLLNLAAHARDPNAQVADPATEVALGEDGIGRVALERRAQVVTVPPATERAAVGVELVAPMSRDGRLAGVLALTIRASRPTSHGELLLLKVFGNRIAEILAAGGDEAQLQGAMQRFRASWRGALDG